MNAPYPPLYGRNAAAGSSRTSWFLALQAWLLVMLMVAPGGFDYGQFAIPGNLRQDNVPTADEGNPATRALWLLFLAVSLVVCGMRWSMLRRLLRNINPFYLGFIVLATISMLWSLDAPQTLRRLMRLYTISLVGIALAVSGWRSTSLQDVLRPLFTLLTIGSLVFGMLRPDLAIHNENQPELVNAWRGLATQKNGLGALSSIAFVLWAHGWLSRQSRLLPSLIGMGAAGACLMLSRSSTSTVATIFCVLTLIMMLRTPPFLRRYLPFMIVLLAGTIVIYSLAVLRLVPGSSLLLAPIGILTGKDTGFTGRSDIWWVMGDYIRAHPYLGSGYGAFWTGGLPGTNSAFLREALRGFYPGSAHNGYLDILNDLGSAGLILMVGFVVIYVRQALRIFKVDRAQGALYLGLFMQHALANLSESHWFWVTSMPFAVMAMATMSLGRAMIELNEPPRQGGRIPAVASRPRPDLRMPRIAGVRR